MGAEQVTEMTYEHSPRRSSRRPQEQHSQANSNNEGRRLAGSRPNNAATIEDFESLQNSALSGERLRQPTAQETNSQQVNYGNRSNISEINEADLLTNQKSDYSISSPKTTAGHSLPLIYQQMKRDMAPNRQTHQKGSTHSH